jgi:hypothetical protein
MANRINLLPRSPNTRRTEARPQDRSLDERHEVQVEPPEELAESDLSPRDRNRGDQPDAYAGRNEQPEQDAADEKEDHSTNGGQGIHGLIISA